jgi:condensin complex subunit 3
VSNVLYRSIIEIISDIQEESSNPFGDMDDLPIKRARLNNSPECSEENGQQTSSDDNGQQTFAGNSSQQTAETSELDSSRDIDNMVVQLRCLNICKRMLENSYEPLTENSNLYGLLNDLIAPAVQNSSADTVVRQEGLHCLGLCCTLDKRLAQHNITLFITCIKQGHEDLVVKAVRVSII